MCLRAKSTCSPHTAKRKHAVRVCQIVCSDILGPLVESEHTDDKYVINFIDDSSNYCITFPIAARSDILRCLKQYKSTVENDHPGVKIQNFCCDNAREYVMGDVKKFCEENGITIDPCNPYTPEQNSKAERFNRTLMEKVRATIDDAKFPKTEWPYVVKAAVYLINRLPTSANEGMITPFEAYYGQKPENSRIRVFGSVAYQHIDAPARKGDKKLDPRAIERFLVGYTSIGYILMDVKSRATYRSCNVEHIESRNFADLEKQVMEAAKENGEFSIGADEFAYEQPNKDPVVIDHPYSMVLVSKSSGILTLSDSIPKSFDEALNSPFSSEWRQAIKDELCSLVENDTYEVVDRPNCPLISTKWVFDVKKFGGRECAKARLVARGFQDCRKYQETEIYSPVIHATTFRWLMSMVNRFDLHLIQLDVKTAFLYGEIEYDDVFIEVPEGLAYSRSGTALRLRKSLYGLKTSSRTWFERLLREIFQQGYTGSDIDQCIFYRIYKRYRAILIVYVDDILFASNCDEWIKSLLYSFEAEFKIKVDFEPKMFLGIEIVQDYRKRIIKLSQSEYTLKILERFQMTEAYAQFTPMETNLKIKKSGIQKESTEMRSMIGAVLYLSRNTRPDICYAVNYLSRFQNETTSEIMSYVKRIFRYLRGSLDFGLVYRSNGERAVTCFVDASFITASDDQYQSTSGMLLYTFGDLISWATKKQQRSVTSTAAAEFTALNDSIKEIFFIRYLNEIIFEIAERSVIYEDNSSAISIAKGTESSESWFLLTKMFAVRQAVCDGEIKIKPVPGHFQLADILTKAVDATTLSRLRPFVVSQVNEITDFK